MKVTPEQLADWLSNDGSCYVRDVAAQGEEPWEWTSITVDGVVDLVELARKINEHANPELY